MNSERGTIGNPFSSKGEGIAHPGGRFDVTRKPAGNGLGVVHAHIGALLERCNSVEEAVRVGVSEELAESYFATKGAVGNTGVLDNK